MKEENDTQTVRYGVRDHTGYWMKVESRDPKKRYRRCKSKRLNGFWPFANERAANAATFIIPGSWVSRETTTRHVERDK